MCGTEAIRHIMAPQLAWDQRRLSTRPPQLSLRRRLDEREAADLSGQFDNGCAEA
jgi:hypothetical protein